MKYFAQKVKTNEGVFDSKREHLRWLVLKQMEREGKISLLKRQVRFEILPRLTYEHEVKMKTKVKKVIRVDEKAKHYTCDFLYYEDGHMVVEDVKSKGTMGARDYSLRRHLIKWLLQRKNEEIGYESWIFKETT